jgi:hypothetical protein
VRVRRATLRPERGERRGLAYREPEPAERKAEVAGIAKFEADERSGDSIGRCGDLKREADRGAPSEPLRGQRRGELDRLARAGAASWTKQRARDGDRGGAEQLREKPARAPRAQ